MSRFGVVGIGFGTLCIVFRDRDPPEPDDKQDCHGDYYARGGFHCKCCSAEEYVITADGKMEING